MITAETAAQHFEKWRQADLGVATFQEHAMPGASLRLVDAVKIGKNLNYWRKWCIDFGTDPITLLIANEHLSAWLKADLAASTSQSNHLGGTQLTSADATAIRHRFEFWQRQAESMSGISRNLFFGGIQ